MLEKMLKGGWVYFGNDEHIVLLSELFQITHSISLKNPQILRGYIDSKTNVY